MPGSSRTRLAVLALALLALFTAILWLVGQFASLMLFWAYVFQKIILNLGYALSPLLIGFMAIPALKQVGTKYLLNLVGVLLWPLGWAVAALVTQGILDFMTDPSFEYIDPTSTLPDLQKTIGVAVVGFWIIFSTVAAPVIIQQRAQPRGLCAIGDRRVFVFGHRALAFLGLAQFAKLVIRRVLLAVVGQCSLHWMNLMKRVVATIGRVIFRRRRLPSSAPVRSHR